MHTLAYWSAHSISHLIIYVDDVNSITYSFVNSKVKWSPICLLKCWIHVNLPIYLFAIHQQWLSTLVWCQHILFKMSTHIILCPPLACAFFNVLLDFTWILCVAHSQKKRWPYTFGALVISSKWWVCLSTLECTCHVHIYCIDTLVCGCSSKIHIISYICFHGGMCLHKI